MKIKNIFVKKRKLLHKNGMLPVEGNFYSETQKEHLLSWILVSDRQQGFQLRISLEMKQTFYESLSHSRTFDKSNMNTTRNSGMSYKHTCS